MQNLKKSYPNKKEILIIFTNNYSLIKMYKHYSQNKKKYNANFSKIEGLQPACNIEKGNVEGCSNLVVSGALQNSEF